MNNVEKKKVQCRLATNGLYTDSKQVNTDVKTDITIKGDQLVCNVPQVTQARNKTQTLMIILSRWTDQN